MPDANANRTSQLLVELEAERACRELLARYGFYADHGLSNEWVDLWTLDAVMDLAFYDDSTIYDDDFVPHLTDDTDLALPLANMMYVGQAEMRKAIEAPRHKRLEGRCQHHMDGQPSIFRLVDESTALILSNSIVYGRAIGNNAPMVQYQNLTLSFWRFQKIDVGWRIAENVRRAMGHPDAADLLKRI